MDVTKTSDHAGPAALRALARQLWVDAVRAVAAAGSGHPSSALGEIRSRSGRRGPGGTSASADDESPTSGMPTRRPWGAASGVRSRGRSVTDPERDLVVVGVGCVEDHLNLAVCVAVRAGTSCDREVERRFRGEIQQAVGGDGAVLELVRGQAAPQRRLEADDGAGAAVVADALPVDEDVGR